MRRPLRIHVAPESGGVEGAEPREPSREELAESLARWRVRAEYYKRILERYASAVREGEQKALPELKALVNADDPAVQQARRLLLDDYARGASQGIEGAGDAFRYDYERHFPELAARAFDLVRGLRAVRGELGTPYWMSLREVWELKAGDPFDKAVFLCSLLLSLGSPNARLRALELEGGLRHPVVLCEFGPRAWLLDPSGQPRPMEAPLEQALEAYRYEGKRALHSLWELNHESYRELRPAAEGGPADTV
jgi:hypothetical protein